jgi:hypothetical protein
VTLRVQPGLREVSLRLGSSSREWSQTRPILGVSSSSRTKVAEMRDATSLQAVLEVVGEFDVHGGASAALVAWELCVHERLVAGAWEEARTRRLIASAGYDQHEQLWRLTPAGWAARQGERESA